MGHGAGALLLVLALAYAGLKKTPEAVDAACRAIVLQGPQHERRARDLTILAKVLPGPPELDEYVALVDRRAAETGTDNPAVRTAMGRSYADYHDERAVTQLRIACGLDPSDAEPRRRLVRFFDLVGQQEAAIGELLAVCRR